MLLVTSIIKSYKVARMIRRIWNSFIPAQGTTMDYKVHKMMSTDEVSNSFKVEKVFSSSILTKEMTNIGFI